ncbi:MFS transporter [Heyndrickxia acidicola]|uniref:MFS transporter n=1 Tax=Heyndrickxia acidicola TaxID=209389 RepID=A0ABU6MJX5_9BACI|nr:MFS transporter [Heyndrickxia acidicola]MED1204682.1 MFS transporter [Heyndrickxia acidicola]
MFSILKEEKCYRKLFAAGIINGIGDRFSQVAMLGLQLQLTGSGFAVGLTMCLRLVPFLFFGTLGGILADRLPRKTILVVTDLVRILFALSFLFVHNKENVWIIYVSSFVLAIGEAIYAPARKSSIPQLVKEINLVQVNSMEQVLTGAVLIGGAFSGGIAAYFFGPQIPFLLNALSFLLAAGILSTIPFPEKQQFEQTKTETKQSPAFWTVKKVLFSSFALQILFLAEMVLPFISGFDNVLISVYAVKVYALGDLGVGLFYGALGIGLMLSSLAANRLKGNLLAPGTVFMILEGLSIVILSQVKHPALAVLFFICNAWMGGIGGTCFDSVLMKETPKEHQGVIFGLLATIGNTIIGIAMLAAGAALDFVPPRVMGLSAGLALMVVGLCFMGLIFVKKTHRQRA